MPGVLTADQVKTLLSSQVFYSLPKDKQYEALRHYPELQYAKDNLLDSVISGARSRISPAPAKVPTKADIQELTPKIPGLLSGSYSAPMTVGRERIQSSVAPGESLPHAITRQAIGGVGSAASGIASTLLHPIKSAESLLTPHETLGATAEEEKKMGPLGRALYNIPADISKSLLEKAGRGDIGAVTEAASLAGLPKAGEAAKESLKRAAGAIQDFRDPASLARRSTAKIATALDYPTGKGGRVVLEGQQAVRDAQTELAQISRTTPLKRSGADRFHELAQRVEEHQDKLWNEAHKPQIQRWAEDDVDHEAIASAAKEVLPDAATDANPAETAKARQWADDVLNKPRTLGQLDTFLRELNNDLRGKRAEPYGPKDVAVRQAAAKAARAEIDRILEVHGEPGVRSFNRVWGALDNIRERALEKGFDEWKRSYKKGPIPDWIHAYSFLHPGASAIPVSVGLGVHLSKMLRGSPARQLGKGMKGLAKSNLQPFEMPPFQLVGQRGLVSQQQGLDLRGAVNAPAREPLQLTPPQSSGMTQLARRYPFNLPGPQRRLPPPQDFIIRQGDARVSKVIHKAATEQTPRSYVQLANTVNIGSIGGRPISIAQAIDQWASQGLSLEQVEKNLGSIHPDIDAEKLVHEYIRSKSRLLSRPLSERLLADPGNAWDAWIRLIESAGRNR